MDTILNISGIYDEEGWRLPGAAELDFRRLDGCCCYCDSDAEAVLRAAIAERPLRAQHWIDSGDYHYISKLWIERINEPFVLALFDNHPDDQEAAFGNLLSCGGWVRTAADTLPLMKGTFRNTAEIPGDLPVYLSIDLDVLAREYAATDWSQGNYSPEKLRAEITQIAAGHRILGADVCGGLSIAKGARPADLSLNAGARRELAAFLAEILRQNTISE